ncbi:unnamed protein product [Peronospora destructor]|uniref:PX domain-containing protein n=1 Tax=Peronospora destructor TaxID=86335 RepID=A0AAV0TQI7_9STRA|nr:unnamed protein product [Peronospora destructor]
MNSPANSLSASITSALALKPSTVYILRIKNSNSRQSWHIRRCFSEFCELREKLLDLIDDQMATYLTSLEVDNTKSSIYTTTSDITSSASSSTSTCNSYRREKHRQYSSTPPSDRFCYVFKQFPPRKLFGSRSKRVIEARCLALNRFLQQALDVVEVVRQRRLIAICFSMMSHIESFLECKAHRPITRVAPSGNVDSIIEILHRQESMSPSAARRASAAMSLTPGFHHYPLVPTQAFIMTLSDHRHQSNASRYNLSASADDDASSISQETQRFNNFDFTQRFYREFGRQEKQAEKSSNDLDKGKEMQMHKKTWSTMLESEFRERKLHHSGSHFSMLETGHSRAEAWLGRVEIAGVHNSANPTRN